MKLIEERMRTMISGQKKGTYSILVISVLSGLMLFVFGCSTELGMNPRVETDSSVSVATSESNASRGVPESALRFIELPKDKGRNAVVDGGCSAEVVIPRETGVRFVLPCTQGDVEVRTGLLVEPYSIVAPLNQLAAVDNSEDVTVSLNVSRDRLVTDVNLVFGPHGTIFDPPAKFIFKVTGLDFSSFDNSGELGFYYYREDTDLWELQEATVSVNEVEGKIIVRAELHHFSRYAVAFTN